MWNKIQKIYLWQDLIWPSYEWTLRRETDFKNSSRWWFSIYWWNWASSPSGIWFNTTEWYIYSTQQHSNARIQWAPADLPTLQDAKAIKIVCDGLWRWNNSNYYNTAVWVWTVNFNKKSTENSVTWWTKLTWDLPDFSTRYTCEFIIEKWWYWILTVSNWSTYQSAKSWDELMTTASWWWFYNWASSRFGNISRDQWTWCQLKDIHVYYAM